MLQVMRKRDLIRKNLVENACFEKEIMCSANNPFIVRSYYSFTSRDNLYIVMEYISGGDTASLLRNLGALDEDVARQYIAETVLVCYCAFCSPLIVCGQSIISTACNYQQGCSYRSFLQSCIMTLTCCCAGFGMVSSAGHHSQVINLWILVKTFRLFFI